jgi:putative zinc finger/helix-turn-helix YgiT family protein
MKCSVCGGSTTEVKEVKKAKYRDEIVEVVTKLFRCDSCQEGFVTPQQMGIHVRAVKNEVRKKYGLLSPEKVTEIRKKLQLTQEGLEELLGTGPKVVVRWESGKVIQSGGHDNMLRLLDRDPRALGLLRQVQQLRSREQKEYARSHAKPGVGAAARTGVGAD